MSGLGEILDGTAVTEALRKTGHEPGPRSLRLQRAWPYGRLPLVALHRQDEPTSGTPWWTVVALSEPPITGRLARLVRRGRAVSLPALHSVALPFPADCNLDLGEAMDAGAAGAALAPWTGSVRPLNIEVLSYKPMRRLVLRYRGEYETALIGKVYRAGKDTEVAALYRRLSCLDGRLAPGLEIPRPCAHLPQLNMLVWRSSTGQSFFDVLEDGRRVAVARHCGRALGVLHQSPVAWERRHTAADELAVVDRWVQAVCRARLPQEHLLARVMEALRPAADATPESLLRPAHRDFYDKQVLVRESALTILDLDLACLAEPELDVANFMAHLHLRAMQGRGLAAKACQEAFLDGYLDMTGVVDEQRLEFYAACSLTRLAALYALRRARQGLTEELADRALTLLSPPTSRSTRRRPRRVS